MSRQQPGDEPALKKSDLELEADFGAYRTAHSRVDAAAFSSAFQRRAAWIGWHRGWSDDEVDAYLRPLVRNLLREHPAASRESAWAYAAKQVVAITHMTRMVAA